MLAYRDEPRYAPSALDTSAETRLRGPDGQTSREYFENRGCARPPPDLECAAHVSAVRNGDTATIDLVLKSGDRKRGVFYCRVRIRVLLFTLVGEVAEWSKAPLC